MEISNDRQLQVAVEKAGALLQQIEDYLCGQPHKLGAVCFPRGLIRPASAHRTRLSFVADPDLKSNLAYTLILTDVIRWVLVRTDLWGTPREMIIKLFVFLGGTLVESITKDYLKGLCGKGYKERTAFLLTRGVIDASLKNDLDWLWDLRNNMHLFLLEQAEYINDYDDKTFARAATAYKSLVRALQKHGRLEG